MLRRARWRWWWRENYNCMHAPCLTSWTPVALLLSHRHHHYYIELCIDAWERESVAAIRIYVSSSSSVKVVCEWNALRCAAIIIVVYTFLSLSLSLLRVFFFFFIQFLLSSFFQILNLMRFLWLFFFFLFLNLFDFISLMML